MLQRGDEVQCNIITGRVAQGGDGVVDISGRAPSS